MLAAAWLTHAAGVRGARCEVQNVVAVVGQLLCLPV
jgi:hypothetical protein